MVLYRKASKKEIDSPTTKTEFVRVVIVEPDYEAAEMMLREGLKDDGALDTTAIVDAALKEKE